MLKYGIGDVVKIKQCINGHHFEIGELVKITNLYDNNSNGEHYSAKNKKGDTWFLEDGEVSNANLVDIVEKWGNKYD